MGMLVLADQQELTYICSVQTLNHSLENLLRMMDERETRKSVLSVWLDDDDDA